MTQTNLPVMTSPTTGTELVNNLYDWRDSLHTLHKGNSAPPYAQQGMLWVNDTDPNNWMLMMFQGSTSIALGTFNVVANTFTPVTSQITITSDQVSYNGDTVETALNDIFSDAYRFMPVGVPFPLMGTTTAPSNAGTRKFIILSSGQSSLGGYNFGLVNTEIVTGSFPTNTASGNIAVGPYAGTSVEFINNTQRFLRGATSNSVENDQMQVITGSLGFNRTAAGNFVGAFIAGGTPATSGATAGTSGGGSAAFDSSNSPNARTGTYTRPRNWGLRYYMRVV